MKKILICKNNIKSRNNYEEETPISKNEFYNNQINNSSKQYKNQIILNKSHMEVRDKTFEIQNIYNLLGMNQNSFEKSSTYVNKNKVKSSLI